VYLLVNTVLARFSECVSKNRALEGGREGGWEVGRKGGREGGRESGRERGREGHFREREGCFGRNEI
jgi:hypothetical protein